MSTAAKEVSICNRLGLHARPAMQFVDLATKFASRIVVKKPSNEPCEVDGKSVMQMITLEAGIGTKLIISADGEDADKAVDELVALVASGFGED